MFERSRMLGDPISLSAVGVNVANGADATIRDSSVDAAYGAFVSKGSLTLERSRVQGRSAEALQMNAEAAGATATTTALDSLLFSESADAVSLFTGSGGGPARLDARGSTLFSRGGNAALSLTTTPGTGPASATLRNSIVRQVKAPGEATFDLRADRSVIDADSSSFTTSQAVDGGSAPAPGTGSNLSGDPGLLDPLGGDFRLRGDSPLIDRGNAAIVTEGERDLAGSPRSLDGNRDCVAVPDIGAYELTGQGVACPSEPSPSAASPSGPSTTPSTPKRPPAVSAFKATNRAFAAAGKARHGAHRNVKRGTRFTFTLSEPARVTIAIERKLRGRKVVRAGRARCLKPKRGARDTRPCARFAKVVTRTAQKQAGRQSLPFSGRVKGKALPAGRYRATLTATDADGQRSAAKQLSFKILPG